MSNLPIIFLLISIAALSRAALTPAPVSGHQIKTSSRSAAAHRSQRLLQAEQFPGADLGTKINAADSALGANCGAIEVSSSGNLTTAVSLSHCHDLIFHAPITWSAPVTLAGKNVIDGTHVSLTGTLRSEFAYLRGRSISDIQIHNVDLRVPEPASTRTYLFECFTCSHIFIHDNSVANAYLATLSTTAANYASVKPGLLSSDVKITNNTIHGTSREDRGAGIAFRYTSNFSAIGNHVDGGFDGIMWWGGDANPQKGDGAVSNPRWASRGTITGNVISNVVDGIWGSMGSEITVSRNQVDTCSDVCLDAEGSHSISFKENTVRDGKRGGALATFFFNRNVVFTGNIVTVTNAAWPAFRTWNNTNDPGPNEDVTLSANRFECRDHLRPCRLESDAIRSITITQNDFGNTVVNLGAASVLHNVSLARNRLHFTTSYSGVVTAMQVANNTQVQGTPALTEIAGNQIEVSAPQDGSSTCIAATFTDYNAGDHYKILNNTCTGAHPFATDIRVTSNSRNRGQRAVWEISGNVLGNRTIVHSLKRGNKDEYHLGDNFGPDGTKLNAEHLTMKAGEAEHD